MRRYAPAWVYASGFLLAAIAGAVNAVAWLGVEHKGITHATGAITEASTRLAHHDWSAAAHSIAVVAAFLVGAMLSGVVVAHEQLRLGRRYGIGFVIESALLFGAFVVRDHTLVFFSDYLAAAACGLQNALATSFSGAVVRTTHMTGVVTDLGLLLGHALRGQKPDMWKFWLYVSLLSGFATGGVVGAASSAVLGARALLLPATATFVAGVAYTLWAHARGDLEQSGPSIAQGGAASPPT
jgi:uncharacterized membrane protein YoaK (UPF0700 family)